MTALDRSPPVPAGGLLANRNFMLLWCAYGVSALGDHLSEMALLKTQDALNVAVDITRLSARMTFLLFVPFFLLGPLTGVLADRLPRRAVMVTADMVRCVLMFGFAVLIAWTAAWGSWGPFVPLLAVGIFAALFSPARSALVPTLIRPDQLIRANGLFGGLGIIATMAAAKIGGMLADRYEPSVAFQLDAATFLASAILLLFIRAPRLHASTGAAPRRSAGVRDFMGGFRYAGAHRHVLELLAIASLVWFCGSMVYSVIPAVVRDVYHGAYSAISNYRAFLGLGFILGATTITVLGDALRSEIAITWGLFGVGGAMAVFAASVFLPFDPNTLSQIGALGIVIAGYFAVAVMASFQALLQRTVPDRYRGRVFGVNDVCNTGALLVATGLLGIPEWTRVDRWVGFILVAVAAIMGVAGFATLSVRLRRAQETRTITFFRHLLEIVAKFWWRFQCEGRCTVPRTGPVIVASNHTCPADPLFLSTAVTYRHISFMVAAEYSSWPVVRSLLEMIECIPVHRGTQETSATKQALRHLEAGKAVGIFIEGRIVPPGETPTPKDGVALLALKTGATVIPAYVDGVVYREGILRGLLTRHRARVRFGASVDLSEFNEADGGRPTVRAATRKIYAAVRALASPRDNAGELQSSADRPADNPEAPV